MICIYCGRETGDEFDEHKECVEESIEAGMADEHLSEEERDASR